MGVNQKYPSFIVVITTFLIIKLKGNEISWNSNWFLDNHQSFSYRGYSILMVKKMVFVSFSRNRSMGVEWVWVNIVDFCIARECVSSWLSHASAIFSNVIQLFFYQLNKLQKNYLMSIDYDLNSNFFFVLCSRFIKFISKQNNIFYLFFKNDVGQNFFPILI